MGEVFLAFDHSLRPVAVKVLRGELADDRQFRARFAQEVRSARRVRGEGIAPLIDADPEAETPWLATAYVAGPTLADAVELYGPLPVSSVLVLMSGIAAALGQIHEAGIVHRDLKPANVVLGAEGLRVIDFGIARAADATPLTLTGMLVGSPQYVAPEQALGLPPEPAGDIFSLGALAHYAATGRPAYGEGPRIAVLYRIVNERPDLAGCPRQIRSLIDSCLARDPADRPTTAELVELCTPDEPPTGATDWLPPSVLFAIDAYRTTLADLLPADPDADYPAPPLATNADAASHPAATPAPDSQAAADCALPLPDASATRSDVPSAIAPVTPPIDAAPDDTDDLGSLDTPADTSPTLHRRLRRGALGFAATAAMLAAGVAVALNLPSGGSSPGSVAAFGGASSTLAPNQHSPSAHRTGAASPTATQQSSPGFGGPPSIPGLGPPPGPPPPGGPPPGGPPQEARWALPQPPPSCGGPARSTSTARAYGSTPDRPPPLPDTATCESPLPPQRPRSPAAPRKSRTSPAGPAQAPPPANSAEPSRSRGERRS